jgi:6-phosphofructokinase 2
MGRIITLTVNPAIDKSTTVAGMSPSNKLRCSTPVFDAGGGGINVSRAIKRLNGESLCMHLSGGDTGNRLVEILEEDSIDQLVVSTATRTRENFSVTDTTTNQQFRFGMPGSLIDESEWKEVLQRLEKLLKEGDYLVASGSLPAGVPNDFYKKVALICEKKNAKLILDTSGEPLLKAAKSGVYLLKPNLGELSAMCGVETVSVLELEDLAKEFLKKKTCEVLVVSLGPQGAMLITENITEHVLAPTVFAKSTIGAGDSMVAGMVFSLAQGKSLKEVVGFGVACGSATTMNSGTQLFNKEDVDKLYNWIKSQKNN